MAAPAGLFEQDGPAVRAWLVPVASVVAGSLASLLPSAAGATVFPSLGLLVLLGWRLLRPEMMGAWWGLPLGLLDDLIGGEALGTAMTLWTIVLLGLDIADTRMVWRDRHADWLLAALSIGFVEAGRWTIARAMGDAASPATIVPPTALGILLFPLGVRLCARLDRLRLGRRAVR